MIPNAKNIKRYFSLKEIAIVLLAVVISVSAGVGVFAYLKKEVVINNNGNQIVIKTMKTTVKEVLEQTGVEVKPDDYISLPLNAKLQKIKKNIINIKKAVPINVMVDGRELQIMTYRDTVKEALANNNKVSLAQKDKLEGATLDDKITPNMNIQIVRVKEELLSEKLSIPFKVVSRENNRLDKGKENTLKEGKEGVREKLYKVVFEDGKQVAKDLIKDSILSNPIDKIIEFGTVLNYKTSRGEVLRYRKAIPMRATAYTASFRDTGKSPGDPGFGVTYTGAHVKKGIIAVDPRVIPLGTRVYVEVAGNVPDYGYAVAADIGGAIKGDLIDLYFDDDKTVVNWGRKRVKVYILVD